MLNILVILFLIIVCFILLYFYTKRYQRAAKTKTSFQKFNPDLKEEQFNPDLKEEQFNPDINTNNWDLHKLRLDKFKRSQYKGLTFFKSSEDKIYYLSENGIKVYC